VLTIRRVQPNDIFPVIALAYDTLPERYNPAIFNQFYENSAESFLVAVQNKTIIGFLIGIKTAQTKARILMLALKETYRNKGIGSTLLQRFISDMQHHGVTSVELELRITNKAAFDFYKKHGFELVNIVPHFYQNQEHAYIMKKEL
jgi:ribosomal-protein-alanine N-acetyltransferase